MFNQGKYEEAVPLLERCVDSGQRMLGSGHFDVATWMDNLANLLEVMSMQQSVSTGNGPIFDRCCASNQAGVAAGGALINKRCYATASCLRVVWLHARATNVYRELMSLQIGIRFAHLDFTASAT